MQINFGIGEKNKTHPMLKLLFMYCFCKKNAQNEGRTLQFTASPIIIFPRFFYIGFLNYLCSKILTLKK